MAVACASITIPSPVSATGLQLNGGRVLIDGNQAPMSGSSPGVANVGCTALSVTDADARIQNNVGGPYCMGRLAFFHALSRLDGKAQIFSNYFAGADNAVMVSPNDEVRNNVIIGSRSGVALSAPFGLPADLDNNAITASQPATLASITIDSTPVPVNSIAELEALFSGAATGNVNGDCASSSGTLSEGSACIGAGSPAGAPEFDFEGDRRDAEPDIGADEYVAP
jgi:hypothetical protein